MFGTPIHVRHFTLHYLYSVLSAIEICMHQSTVKIAYLLTESTKKIKHSDESTVKIVYSDESTVKAVYSRS